MYLKLSEKAYSVKIFNGYCIFLITRTHAKLYLKNFISRSQLTEYEISEAVCSGSESSLAECKMSLVPALKCNMALGIHCFSGIKKKKMIKYILYYISCDKGKLVTLESFFLPIITGILFLVVDTIFYSPTILCLKSFLFTPLKLPTNKK